MVHSCGGDFYLLLRATLPPVVHSLYFSHTTNEKEEVNKSFFCRVAPKLNSPGTLPREWITALCSSQIVVSK